MPIELPEPVECKNCYKPKKGVTWQWQLQGTVDTSIDAELYEIDLDVDQYVIDKLHQDGRKVIAYFSAGSAEDWRSDYGLFNVADLGSIYGGYPNERWLDIRNQNVFDIMVMRIEAAKIKKFDGIEFDNVNGYESGNNTGFNFTSDDQLLFNAKLANAAHQHGLCAILKNDGPQAKELAPYFDATLTESCLDYNECKPYEDHFLKSGKAVLHAQYFATETEAQQELASTCGNSARKGFSTLLLHISLDNRFRFTCP